MRAYLLPIFALAILGCAEKPGAYWIAALRERTTEGNADLQLSYCGHPPQEATEEGRRLCRDVVGFAIVDLRRPVIDAGVPPYTNTACRHSLEALMFAARADPRWIDRRDRVVARCCRSPYGPAEACANIGAPRPSVTDGGAR